MKAVSAKTMAALEDQAYQQECSDCEFMEQAGEGVAERAAEFLLRHQLPKKIILLCGKGNNGGDAFVAGCHLLDWSFQVDAIQLDPLEKCSPLCKHNRKRFINKRGKVFSSLSADFKTYSVILDGLFGTGFKGQVKEPYASLIDAANQSQVPILAVDIPSGLDGTTGQTQGSVIQATETIFLGLPKTGFFLQDGWNIVGKLFHADFGLPYELIEKAQADFLVLTLSEMVHLIPPIKRNRHKYQAGYVIGLAGSPGMPGAALLASLAALRGGSGMVRLLHPEGMQAELSASPYELIKLPYQWDETDKVLETLQKPGATFIGPGLGRTEETRTLLKAIMPHLEKPCVIDADALILYAEGAFTLPKQAVLTPHTGEMQHLLHHEEPLMINKETLQVCQRYADENHITLVLKGAPTFIFHPGEPILVNPTGDPGMATAGSGDVLTGFIASLLSQGLSCRNAAALGVYLHGLAGEFAAQVRSSYSVIASDLIFHLSDAYLTCLNYKNQI